MEEKKAEEVKKRGRPTTYKPEYCQMIIDFFKVDTTIIEKKTEKNKHGWDVTTTTEKAIKLPLLIEFCDTIGGTSVRQLHKWCDKNPEFKEAYAIAREHQKRILSHNTLMGYYDARYSQFLAKWMFPDAREIDNKNLSLKDAEGRDVFALSVMAASAESQKRVQDLKKLLSDDNMVKPDDGK